MSKLLKRWLNRVSNKRLSAGRSNAPTGLAFDVLEDRLVPTSVPLHVVGNKLMDAANNEVVLRGVNIGGLESYPTGLKGDQDQVLQAMDVALNDWHANLVRLTVYPDFWFGHDQGVGLGEAADGGAAYRNLVNQLIGKARASNAYVMLTVWGSDMGHPGAAPHLHYLPDSSSTQFWNNATFGAARLYANDPAVLFDPFNEPHEVSWDEWRNGGQINEDGEIYNSPGMQGLLNAIRATGANNIVAPQGLGYGADLSGVTAGYALNDSAGNLMYQIHLYPAADKFNDDDAPSVAVRDARVQAVAAQYPIYVGEWGTYSDVSMNPDKLNVGAGWPDANAWSQNMLAWLNQHHYNWTAWNLNPEAGPHLISDYDYTPTDYFGAYVKAALAAQITDQAPTAVITAVSPDPRNSAVAAMTITFSEAISGFNLPDLQLKRNGSTVALTGAVLTSGDNITWTLTNLSGLTASQGSYSLTLTAAGSGIIDSASNALAASASTSWTVDNTVPTATALTASNTAFSPNASIGSKDTTNFSSTFTDAITVGWTLTIKNSSAAAVKTFTGAGNVSQAWDGKNDSSAFVADGLYTATLSYHDAVGNAGVATSKTVRVDNKAPIATALSVSDAMFSPNNSPETLDTTRFTSSFIDVATPVSWNLTIKNSSNTPVKMFTGIGNMHQLWDGKNDSNAFVADGIYTATVTCSDAAGNAGATTSKTVTVDNIAPKATALAASNAAFSPNASIGSLDTTTFSSTFTDATTVSWILTIKNSSAAVLKTFTGAGNMSQVWDGKNDSNAFVADGIYTATLTYSDGAGNPGDKTSKSVTVDKIAPKATALAASNALFSPGNSPATLHTTTFSSTIIDPSAVGWTLTITNSSNTTVKTFTGSTGGFFNVNVNQIWDGKNNSNAFVADDLYTATLTYIDTAGNPGGKTSKTVRVDNTAPMATALAASNAAFSPGASSGVQDSTIFSSTMTDASTVSWTLTIKSSGNITVKTFTGIGNVNQAWDGKNSNNASVANGLYTATLIYRDAAGIAGASTSKTVTVDNIAPIMATPLTASNTSFSPNASPGIKDTTTFSATFTDTTTVSWTLTIKKGSIVVRTFSGSGKMSQIWDGKNSSNAFVANGLYSAILTYFDAAGNAGSQTSKLVTVNNT